MSCIRMLLWRPEWYTICLWVKCHRRRCNFDREAKKCRSQAIINSFHAGTRYLAYRTATSILTLTYIQISTWINISFHRGSMRSCHSALAVGKMSIISESLHEIVRGAVHNTLKSQRQLFPLTAVANELTNRPMRICLKRMFPSWTASHSLDSGHNRSGGRITGLLKTHLPLVPHICASESGQHWFR